MTPAEHVAGFVAEGDAGPPQDDRLDRRMRGAAFPGRTAPAEKKGRIMAGKTEDPDPFLQCGLSKHEVPRLFGIEVGHGHGQQGVNISGQPAREPFEEIGGQQLGLATGSIEAPFRSGGGFSFSWHQTGFHPEKNAKVFPQDFQ
jgi:hypothetical protein